MWGGLTDSQSILLGQNGTQVNCKICWFCVVLFEGKSPLKKFSLNLDGLSKQEIIGQKFITHELFQDWSSI